MDQNMIAQMLMGTYSQQNPNPFMTIPGQRWGNNYDQMYIPQTGLPNDKNTVQPADAMNARMYPQFNGENL